MPGERLEVGRSYVALGPAAGSKLAPAQEVEIVGIDEDAGRYLTKGSRQVATVIAFGCEHLWRPAETCGSTAPGAGGVEDGPDPERAASPRPVSTMPAPSLLPAWHDGRMVAFDLETTSAEPEEARIVTAAIAACGGGLETETLALLADPGVEIPEEAAAIHGVTTERAVAEGLPAADVVTGIIEALAVYAAEYPLVVFNARYDLTVLDREARRHGIVPLTDRVALRVIDPLVLDKWLHRYRKGSRKLDAQAAHYGATLDEAHDAAADAIAAARVAWCIGKRGQVIRRVRNGGEALELRRLQKEWESVRYDLDLLHAAQTVWAAEQAAGLEDYFREQGKPERVNRAWPLIPYTAAEAVAA